MYNAQALLQVYFIEMPEDIGDLAGAIQGNRFSGFIGELYTCFPFPENPLEFKQNPQGFQTQSKVSKIIEKYARLREISFEVSSKGREIKMGVYRFNRDQFQELLLYVWRGGYPRWKDEIRPTYVKQMRDNILQNCKGMFENIIFEDYMSGIFAQSECWDDAAIVVFFFKLLLGIQCHV